MRLHIPVINLLLLSPGLGGSAVTVTEQSLFASCEEKPGNQLLQTHVEATHKIRGDGAQGKPWDRRNYLVATSHKAGSHLLRNVMHRTFDVLGANYSCHYNNNEIAAVITTVGGQHQCLVDRAPIRFQNGNNPETILQMRLEGELRGVMIIRDPFVMVSSAYVYHHRGEEKGNPIAPPNVTSMNARDGVPALAETMLTTIQSMTEAYQVARDDVLAVRYEDLTRSARDFDATVEKILDFLFGDEITETQRKRVMDSARNEDINGPNGLSKSLDQNEKKANDIRQDNHTNDEDDLKKAELAVPLIPNELYGKYMDMRKTLGYV